MSERFYCKLFNYDCWHIFDKYQEHRLTGQQIVDLLNKQDEQIKNYKLLVKVQAEQIDRLENK